LAFAELVTTVFNRSQNRFKSIVRVGYGQVKRREGHLGSD